jgi:hypothetical protein
VKCSPAKQGTLLEFVELSQVAQDLSIMSADIDAKLQTGGLNGTPSRSGANLEGESEQALFRLCH